MSYEVLSNRQRIFDFFPNPGRGRPQKASALLAGAGWYWMLRPTCLDLQKKLKMLCLLVIRISWDI